MLEQIESDLKAAMLAGDKHTVETLKSLKSAVQYEAVSKSVKPNDLNKEQLQAVFAREAKKRQEAAELYAGANEADRADNELAEKAVIDKYLPEQMPEDQLLEVIKQEIAAVPGATIKDMGKLIGAVKAKTAGSADGSAIARLVRQQLEQQ